MENLENPVDLSNLENIFVIQSQQPPIQNQPPLPLAGINELMEMIRKSNENQLQINNHMMGKIEGISQKFNAISNDITEMKNKKGENEIEFDSAQATCSKIMDLANEDSLSVLASEGGLDNPPKDSSVFEEDMSQTTSVAESDSNPSLPLPDELCVSTRSLLGDPQGGGSGCGTGGSHVSISPTKRSRKIVLSANDADKDKPDNVEVQVDLVDSWLDDVTPPANENLGPAIDTKIAAKALTFWKTNEDSVVKKLQKEYKIPSNCEKIGIVPKIDKKILNKMKPYSRRIDSSYMSSQKSISSVIGALLQVADKLTNNERAADLAKRPTGLNLAEVTKPLLDSIAMLSQVNMEVSTNRKKALASASSLKAFKEICQVPSETQSESLLPADLPKAIKDQRELSKAMGLDSDGFNKSKGKGPYKNRGKPYNRGKNNNNNSNNSKYSDFWQGKQKKRDS